MPQKAVCTRTLKEIFWEKKSFAGPGIQTHDLLTCVFLPGHCLPYRDLRFRIDHFGTLYSGGPSVGNNSHCLYIKKVGVPMIHLQPRATRTT